MKPNWLKFKRYPHIGQPLLTDKDVGWIRSYVSRPRNIEKHKFLPLLHRTITQRKFRPQEEAVKNPSGKRKRKVGIPKKREIFFPSHLDSMVYSYYNHLLNKAYEKYLSDKPFRAAPVAYRKIAKKETDAGNKCNIEFAKEAFEFILDNKHRKLSVIVADVTSFFDNLDHRQLHQRWKQVLGVNDLPKDHYQVYKSLIHFSYVNERDLFKRFQEHLIVSRYPPNDTNKPKYKPILVKKQVNVRKENVVSYCTKADFFAKAKDLIRLRKEATKGIPQGTPISATLANIYMIEFDKEIFAELSSPQYNVFYQRYSDDLILVCDQKDEEYFYNKIIEEIEKKAKLDIQRQKTHVYRYELQEDGILRGGLWEQGRINPRRQLEYLGFSFDGNKVLVKTVSFSKFYRKMKRAFRRGAHFAKNPKSKSHNLYEWRLYKKFTHLGAHRRLIHDKNGKVIGKGHEWGNFISYLNKANEVMYSINKDDSIKRQYRKVWNNFSKIKKQTYLDIEVHLAFYGINAFGE